MFRWLERYSDFIYFLLRFVAGFLFACHGAQKLFGVLGGTTWLSGGLWAPDGAFTRFVSPTLLLVWAVAVSLVLTKSPATRSAW